MFPAHELIAAEDAYRRERMIAVRPPRRTRRTHTVRHPRPDRRRPWARLVLSRVRAVADTGDGAYAPC